VGGAVLTISAVIAAELFNTALENVVDMITSQFSQTAKVVKDTAAAAVLVVSIAAAIIGILVFLPAVYAVY
jgi:diacylglycerol kinase